MKLFYMFDDSEIVDLLSSDEFKDGVESKADFEKSAQGMINHLRYFGIIGDVLAGEVEETAKEQRVNAGLLHKHATQGVKQSENLAQAIAERKALYDQITSGELSFEEIKELSPDMTKVIKVIDSEGKIGFTKGDDGKITLKGSTRSGNGDRTNPLPDFKTAENIKRGQNGNVVLCTKTDDEWFGYKEDGTCHNLGKATSWTHLNNRIGKEMLNGKGSDGVNGLSECEEEDLVALDKLISDDAGMLYQKANQ